MESLKISEISSFCAGTFTEDGVVKDVKIDIRKVERGNLFIAIKGDNTDGHKYVKAAAEAGAGAVMIHEDIEVDCPKIMVKDTREALMDLAKAYRRLFNIPSIAITGSVGKTTTKEMVAAVVSQKYNTLKNEGNFNNRIGMPLSVLNLTHEHEAAVFEMGVEFSGDIRRLSTIAYPDIGIVSNIGVSHIENFGSRENICKAKMEILDGMKKDAPIILSKDDDMLKKYEITGRKAIYYSISESADYAAENVELKGEHTVFDIAWSGGRQKIDLPAIGDHNVKNALAAFACGMVLGVSPESAAKGLSEYVPSGMRQRVVHKNDVTIIEDCYNASPDSMKAAFSALEAIEAKRRILVLGDILELGSLSKKLHLQVGELAGESKADIIFAYGNDAQYYVEAAKSKGKDARLFKDKSELAQELFDFLKPGDAILFKASRGMKLEDVFLSIYDRWENK